MMNATVPTLDDKGVPCRHVPRAWIGRALVCCAAWHATVVEAAPLRVRGQATFKALRTQPTADGGYQVIGYVRDAFDQPLPSRRVQLLDARGRACESDSDVTGPEGEFCFRVDASTGTRVGLFVAETEFHAAAEARIALDPSEARFSLLIHLESDELDLEAPTHPLRVQLESASSDHESYPVHISLRGTDPNGQVRFSASAPVSRARSANFVLESEELGPPGPAVLQADISVSDHRLAHAEHQLTLVDTAHVTLQGRLDPVRPAQGFDVEVEVTGKAGAVHGGWVEAAIGSTQVGMAKVNGGRATVPIRFQAPRREQLPFSLRYVAESPWYRPGPVLETTIEVLPPPWWAHAPWIALAVVASYWIIRTWRRPGRRVESETTRVAARGLPEAVLLKPVPNADAWSGSVMDAHTGLPIRGARLQVELPSIENVHVAASTETDAGGRFSLPKVSKLPESARLVVSAKAHSELRQPVPALGELSVSLVERRRYVLLSLTRWAKAMGRPWLSKSDPTPADVARIAHRLEATDTRNWAADIERAAYGPTEPDEDEEHSLVARTPPLDRPGPHKR